MGDKAEENESWVFGLPKMWLGIVNIGAIFLICLMFYQDRRESLLLAKEDRNTFKEAIEKLSENSREQSSAIRVLGIQIQKLNERLDKEKQK